MADGSDSPTSSQDSSLTEEERPSGNDAARSSDQVGISKERPPPSLGTASRSFPLDRIVRFVLGAAVVGAVGWMFWYFAGIVVYLIVGGVLAYLLRPIVDRIQGLGVGRVPAILGSFVLVAGGIAVALTSVIPFVARQVQDLSQFISVDTAAYVANYVEGQIRRVIPIEPGILEKNVRQLSRSLLQGDLIEGERIADTVSSVVSVFTNIVYAVVIIPFVTFFLLKDEFKIRRNLLSLVPNRYFEVTLSILAKVERNIGRYFRALLIQGTAIALIASFLLWIVGLRGAIAIGIFTGVANTIPYFGPLLGFLAGTLVGIAQTGNMALVPGVALAMALTQLVDNVLLQPLIFSRAAQTHPLVILFVVLVGAQLGGLVGMLVAIPLTTTVRVIVEQLLWSLRNYRILRAG
ncbi:MAG: AI-2E family transporter [Salinibacter sp.]